MIEQEEGDVVRTDHAFTKASFSEYQGREVKLCELQRLAAQKNGFPLKWEETLFSAKTWMAASFLLGQGVS